jgi:hypothetical protein
MTRGEQPDEIANTIENALSELGMAEGIAPSFRRMRSSKWPQASAAKMEAIFGSFKEITIQSWEEISCRDGSQEQILRWAFAPGEFVCTGSWMQKAGGEGEYLDLQTLSLEEAIKLASSRQFIVPNPFKTRTGRTKSGKPSCKSDSQVAARRFLIIEFDFRAFDWTASLSQEEMFNYQARLHWHLACEYPLCLLVFSGNESIHGWYATLRPRELMKDAARLGADTRLWSVSQFTRMPWGLHANGASQKVIFFKPGNLVP